MLSIATINVQNKYKIKNYNGTNHGDNHIQMLLDLINKYHIEILGLQEVNYKYKEQLEKKLGRSFTYYGKFRYPLNCITKNIYPFSVFNESVPIITNQEVLDKETQVLPWISSYVPRIVTIMKIKTKEVGTVVVLNTHLDYLKNGTKVKQLKKLLNIIQKISWPIILMGDFNMTVKNKDFLSFIDDLKDLNIKHVDINEATFKYSKSPRAIDHIFLSNCFNVEKVLLDKNPAYLTFSDHYPVILKLSLGFDRK